MVICSAVSVELTDTVRNPLGYYRNTTMNSRALIATTVMGGVTGRRASAQRDFHLHIISSPRAFTAPGCGSSSCRIKGPDREFAAHQRPPFIAVHGRESLSHVGKNGREFLRPLRPRLYVAPDLGRQRH